MITPLECYYADLKSPDFTPDTAQENAVRHIQRLYEALVEEFSPPQGLWATLRYKWQSKPAKSLRGLYFWGGVGRGKTYLVDNFHKCLPFPQKMRVHFHRFMRQVHQDLKVLENTRNPLPIVAQQIATKARVLCLDEFHVADITDAMLLYGLLKALFDQGVVLVATSNVAPNDLYKNGLQRDRFLPAIALLKTYTEIINVDNGIDYRLRSLEQAEIYHYPLDEHAERNLLNSFMKLAPDTCTMNAVLEINGRQLRTVRCAEGVVWFDFQALCDIPRAVADYIELAKCFNTVLLSNIRSMGEAENDLALRLINLVDEFYDRHVKLIISAQTPPELLYTGRRQAFEFRRTVSRLAEMCSQEYLRKPHLP